ncbi:MAG: U32 family peptidase [Burkholderiaceae bacterium]
MRTLPSQPAALELLAPARTADIGIEAINHGADAVYIGGPGFGARAGAGNEVAELERLTRHAHRFGSRIFVTLNTILRDDELEAARQMVWQVYEAGADALIVQDMGLLELDLPPIQLHASTQCDIRTPAKAKFLQDVGFSQIVLARELTLAQIREVAAVLDAATIEFFIHGALCVAYSGQCYVSHAQTGRSANRGDCSQACRLPYTVTDSSGRIVAHDKHVLSMKDNNQSDNLAALIDAGVRSFKIEGRYKDMGYVKNITAHYRQRLDAILDKRPELHRASSGRCEFSFAPDPDRNFNRGSTDYFVNGRQIDIGAFDTPKHAGLPLGYVGKLGPDWFAITTDQTINNGDGLTYWDLQKELVGVQVNRAEAIESGWRIFPAEAIRHYKDLRGGAEIARNRDMAWDRQLDKKSAERRIGVWLRFSTTAAGFALEITDEDGHSARAEMAHAIEPARDPERAEAGLREHLAKLGASIFSAYDIAIDWPSPVFVPASVANGLRRAAIELLEAERLASLPRLARAKPAEPAAPYPESVLTYLANIYNHKARDFYARHGVEVIAPAYESHEEDGEVSLMITKHCVRWSLSLCPKQAKGVTGVQGTIRAEPLVIQNGKEKLTLRFDCKPCEMHVMGKIKRAVVEQERALPLNFYRTRPNSAARSVSGR